MECLIKGPAVNPEKSFVLILMKLKVVKTVTDPKASIARRESSLPNDSCRIDFPSKWLFWDMKKGLKSQTTKNVTDDLTEKNGKKAVDV